MGFFDNLYENIKKDNPQTSLKVGIGAATCTGLADFVVRGKPRNAILLWISVCIPGTILTSLFCDYKKRRDTLKNQQMEALLKYSLSKAGTADDLRNRTAS